MNALRLYGHYAAASVRAQLQYPGSLLTTAGGQLAATAITFLGLWARFDRFGQIAGFRMAEVALFYGFVNVVFAVADSITRGFDVFGPEYVQSGQFDRLLVRPRGLLLQLFGHELRLSRLGRVAQGAVVFAWALTQLELAWTPADVATLLFAFSGALAMFCGVLVLQATLAFWTLESLEVMNVLSHGGVEASQYPVSVYRPWLRNLLRYVLPLAAVTYYPLLSVLGRVDPLGAPAWVGRLSPALGFVFFGLTALLWRVGVRHYTSTGG